MESNFTYEMFSDRKRKNFYKILIISFIVLVILIVIISQLFIPESYTVSLSNFECLD